MRTFALVGLLFALVVMVGCGGSSSTPAPAGQSGAVTGQLAGPSPQSYTVYVDGAKTAVTPTATGAFQIPNLPPGLHKLALIAASGKVGAYLSATVTSGGTTDVGSVTPVTGGEITGLVMQVDNAGNLTPLSGVQVLADPQVFYVMNGGSTTGSSTVGSGGAPAIYPPTPIDGNAVEYTAVTDDSGAYTIPAVPPGPYTVTVTVPGLEQGVDYVVVQSGSDVAANFQLKTVVAPGVGTIQGTVQGRPTPATSRWWARR